MTAKAGEPLRPARGIRQIVMQITLDKPATVIKQREVSATISQINVNRIVLNYRLKQARAFTDGGGAPVILAADADFDTLVGGDTLNLKALSDTIKTKVLSGDTGRGVAAQPAGAARAARV